jgi:hypothetical protein
MEKMTPIQAIKTYFGQGPDARPIETKELMVLRKSDPKGYDEIVKLCGEALGVEIVSPSV